MSKKAKKATVHLMSPEPTTFCGLDSHKVYMDKDLQLVNLKRLVEVDCEECLWKAIEHYDDLACSTQMTARQLRDAAKKLDEKETP